MIPQWIQDLLPAILCGAIGYCIGSLRDVHAKLDKLQKQTEHLHAQLHNSGTFDNRRN
jgi:hypothetical protein